jgi:hypothetical protein
MPTRKARQLNRLLVTAGLSGLLVAGLMVSTTAEAASPEAAPSFVEAGGQR